MDTGSLEAASLEGKTEKENESGGQEASKSQELSRSSAVSHCVDRRSKMHEKSMRCVWQCEMASDLVKLSLESWE